MNAWNTTINNWRNQIYWLLINLCSLNKIDFCKTMLNHQYWCSLVLNIGRSLDMTTFSLFDSMRCWDWRKQWFRCQRRMEWDGMDVCWGGMMGMFWEKHWGLKWRARGSEDNQGRSGRRSWRRTARVFVWSGRMPWIERDGQWELERLLLEWGKSGHPHLRG